MLSTDKLIILGDFNAMVSTDNTSLEGVLGPECIGSCNSNGLMLPFAFPFLPYCTIHLPAHPNTQITPKSPTPLF